MKQVLLLMAICASMFLQAQLPNYVPTSGLLGWWGFEGNGNDLSGNANNLTNNGSTYTTDRFGTPNAAGQFSGNNQFQVVNTPTFSFGQNGDFTVSMWFKKSSFSYGVLIMSGLPSGGPFVWNMQSGNTGAFQFGTNRQGLVWTWAQTSHPINQWTHAVGTFSNGAMTLYFNGVVVATATYTHTTATQQTVPLYIGRGVSGNYAQADIDDIGVWNRVLSSAEISDLYQGCGAAVASQPSNQLRNIGGNATFGVSATGSGISFEWQYNDGSSWQPVANSGQFSGAQFDTLFVSTVTMANDGAQFRCILTESATCADTSNVVTLSVCGELTSQPSDTTVFVNNGAAFSVAHSDPNATFQWQIADSSGVFNNLTDGLNYSGVNTATLTIINAALAMDQETYRCLTVSGSCTGNSGTARLIVINNISTENPDGIQSIRVFPNPTQDHLTVSFQNGSPSNEVTYEIYSAIGAKIFSGTTTPDATIAVYDLSNGSYFIVFDKVQTVPFIKN
ncbi:MAG: T9SS type A sorting domain-containing protein [Schleiferiaceae bacterium]|nr:T9SS type A sorting domain-containing protein [Schleiferiaceae bacterium]